MKKFLRRTLKMKTRTVKLRTKKGKILTLHNVKQNNETISGIDKFDMFVIIPLEDIAEMLPETRGVKW